MEESTDQTNQVPPVNPENATLESPYIGFWPRFAAFSLDSLITTLMTMALFIPLGMLVAIGGSEMSAAAIIVQILGYLVTPGYFIYFTHTSQSTLGKRFIGIKVLAADGYKLSFGKVVLRETIGRIVNMFTAYLSYIIVAFTGKKQGLHDMIVSSVVVRIDPTKELNQGRIGFGIFVGMIPLIIITLLAIVFFIAFQSNK